jgi:arylformamidase
MTSTLYLSYPLSDNTPLFGNAKGISLIADKQRKKGDSCNTMLWSFPNHAGTHIDAPLHFDFQGKSITDFPAGFWIFNQIEILDISGRVSDSQIIIPEDFPVFRLENPDLVLLKTGYHQYRGTDRYTLTPPGVSPKVADWLRRYYPSVSVLGMDLISVSSYANRTIGREAHHSFLNPKSGIPILLLEDLCLEDCGELEKVIVVPIRVQNADAAPCTVIAFQAVNSAS